MDNKYSVIYSAEARRDLTRIKSYIASVLLAPQAATGQTKRIRKSIRALESMPEKFAVVDWEPWHSIGVRKLPVDNYVVFYYVDKFFHQVNILRIFYGGRNIEEIINNQEA